MWTIEFNTFMLAAGLLYVGATVAELLHHNYLMATVYGAYAIASFGLAFV